ncbi:MAG: ABC transporter ATP-binding protein [Nakamurella sp.]
MTSDFAADPRIGARSVAPLIVAVDVRKVFRRHTERATSLKERLLHTRNSDSEDFVALAGVTADITPGSTVGLIGPNGSGKSTLLKILSGILRPTSGIVEVGGRVASLLELGAGFNGELTGRDNVYLNASLLGLSRLETAAAMDSIIEFSELAEFIDQPVKHYSSGMYVRLGFAVAIHVDPDILLVDEVLAVGDEAFQRKCMDKIHEFQEAGKTILFVSHSLDQVRELCTRAIVLNKGVVVDDAVPEAAIETLRRIMGTDVPPVPHTHTPDDGFVFGDVSVSQHPGGPAVVDQDIPWQDGFCITCEFTVNAHWAATIAEVQIVGMGDHDYPLFMAKVSKSGLPTGGGRWLVHFELQQLPRLYGHFRIGIQVSDGAGRPLAHTRSRLMYGLISGKGPTLLELVHRPSAEVDATITP